jgi:hypothetical protein
MFSYEAKFQQQLDLIGRLRQQVEGLFQISDVRTTDQGEAVMFVGRLARDAESVYTALRERFNSLGYTPVMRREGPERYHRRPARRDRGRALSIRCSTWCCSSPRSLPRCWPAPA